jgi:hypothetical protein
MTKIILGALMLALLTSGCYTILQHPPSETNYAAEDYRVDCLQCHGEYHEYPYGYFYGHYPDYWWSTPRWGRYYAYPWWWDNYWYDGSYRHTEIYDDEPSPRSSRGKKVERRETLRPPYSIGTSSLGGSSSGSSIITRGSSNKAIDQNNQSPANPDNTKTKVKEEKTEKKENKKATRRGGRAR